VAAAIGLKSIGLRDNRIVALNAADSRAPMMRPGRTSRRRPAQRNTALLCLARTHVSGAERLELRAAKEAAH